MIGFLQKRDSIRKSLHFPPVVPIFAVGFSGLDCPPLVSLFRAAEISKRSLRRAHGPAPHANELGQPVDLLFFQEMAVAGVDIFIEEFR
ncbi:hypothetical protein C475_18766 [Halosimplex carlsbadense 2-9-1]|uniref:Uncharacterized protein n=1 Tax=Halosimplex carlsbadense 2-9-1 TaxID=797114 RepID=M0CI02_9EURY|nr:hypothetical protein C475_18766 [Halosimplex carlsbadense 2-9-1]